jgi:roadblock/LC7 domain-containing protein
MSIVAELLTKPGVIVAGEYAYRGDRFFYKGALKEKHARMASVMCRATTMSTHMEGDMIAAFCPQSGIQPVRGWVMSGPEHTVCVVANVFCLIDNKKGSLNTIIGFMRQALANVPMDLV